MKYTNKYSFPRLFAEAAIRINESYVAHEGVFRSATGLIAPPQVSLLTKRHSDRITIDVADLVWIVIGKGTHYILEMMPGEELLKEDTLFFSINGHKIQTTPDLVDLREKKLWDYKITSTWSVIRGLKDEWEKQVNIGNYALRKNGIFIDTASIFAILRDWSKTKARIETMKSWTTYPVVQGKVLDVPLWSDRHTEEYISDRIEVHKQAEDYNDLELATYVPCTPEERWEKAPVFAAMKKGRKSAVKLCDTAQEAATYIANGKADYIDTRKGESPRCSDYCDVAPYCHQWKQMQGNFA